MVYQAMRISRNGIPTYGDTYKRIFSERALKHNEIVEIRNEKFIILFEEEVATAGG